MHLMERKAKPKSVVSCMIVTTLALMLALCYLFDTIARAAEPKGGPLTESVDQKALHATWRNLANESVMFPLDTHEAHRRLEDECLEALDILLQSISEVESSLRL